MSASAQTRGPSSRRSARLNAVAATAFLVGGSLFALGAALAQAGVNPTVCASVYLVGGAFFSTGGYASVLQAVNAPRPQGVDPAAVQIAPMGQLPLVLIPEFMVPLFVSQDDTIEIDTRTNEYKKVVRN